MTANQAIPSQNRNSYELMRVLEDQDSLVKSMIDNLHTFLNDSEPTNFVISYPFEEGLEGVQPITDIFLAALENANFRILETDNGEEIIETLNWETQEVSKKNIPIQIFVPTKPDFEDTIVSTLANPSSHGDLIPTIILRRNHQSKMVGINYLLLGEIPTGNFLLKEE